MNTMFRLLTIQTHTARDSQSVFTLNHLGPECTKSKEFQPEGTFLCSNKSSLLGKLIWQIFSLYLTK